MQRFVCSVCFVTLLCSIGNGQAALKSTPAERHATKPSVRLGHLLIVVNAACQYPVVGESKPFSIALSTTIKNVGQNPVCAMVEAKLETTDKVVEPLKLTVGDLGGPLRKLEPGELVHAGLQASLGHRAEPLKLRINETEARGGCSDVTGDNIEQAASISLTNMGIVMIKPAL